MATNVAAPVTAQQTAKTDNQQYLRTCQLLVVDNKKNALDLSELRIKFSVKHSESMTPNNADIRVYNMDPNLIAQIRKEFKRVILQGGYPGNYGVIFQGNIKQAIEGRESATDTFVDFVCGDGDIAYNFAIVATSLKAGSTSTDHLNAIVAATTPMGVTLGTPGVQPTNALPRGKVMYGNARDQARLLGQTTGQSFSIQNEKIQFVPVKAYLPGEAVVLTSKTGMIGTPQQTNEGVNIKCLMNPLIRPNGRVKIDNKSILQLKINLANAKDPVNVAPPLTADGVYFVLIVEHAGDTRGLEWYTNIVGIIQDVTTNPINSVVTSYGP